MASIRCVFALLCSGSRPLASARVISLCDHFWDALWQAFRFGSTTTLLYCREEANRLSSFFSTALEARQILLQPSEAGWQVSKLPPAHYSRATAADFEKPAPSQLAQRGKFLASEVCMEPRTAAHCCHMSVLHRSLRPVLFRRTAPGCKRRHVRQTRQRCTPSAAVGPAPKAPDGGDNWEPWKKKSKDVRPATRCALLWA